MTQGVGKIWEGYQNLSVGSIHKKIAGVIYAGSEITAGH